MAAPADFGTARRLIKMAYRDCGKVATGREPNSEQYRDGLERLGDLINHLRTRGIKLWLLEDISVPLVAAQREYTFGPSGDVDMVKPFRVEWGYGEDSAGNRRELTPMAYVDWARLSNLTTQGTVTQYFVDKQYPLLKVSFWLTPDATQASQEVHLIMRKNAEYIDNLSEDILFPPEWYMALRWALADELASGSPIPVQQRCQQRAAAFIDDLEGFDIENVPTQFVPARDSTANGWPG